MYYVCHSSAQDEQSGRLNLAKNVTFYIIMLSGSAVVKRAEWWLG